VQEVTVVVFVDGVYESLDFGQILLMSKVDKIDRNIIPLQLLRQLHQTAHILLNGRGHKDNTPLPLTLIQPVFQRQLAYTQGSGQFDPA